jgi:hypothetical protein
MPYIRANEATDVANQEQLAISIRFISNSRLCEKSTSVIQVLLVML